MAGTGLQSNTQKRKSALKSDLFQVAVNQLPDEDGFGSDTLYFYVVNETDEVVRRSSYTSLSSAVSLIVSSEKTSAYTVTTDDNNIVLLCDGTFTVTLVDVSTVDNGFNLYIKNKGSGTITIDGDGADVEGSSSIAIGAGVSRHLVTDETEWYII